MFLVSVVTHTSRILNHQFEKAAGMWSAFVLGLACLGFAPGTTAALIGMGIDMYNPPCAHACRRAVESNLLSCSSHEHSGGHMHGASEATTPECRAGDTAYLTTLAWCMSTNCAEYQTPTSRLEKFWETETTGDPKVLSKWDYGTTLQNITPRPVREVTENDTLDFTAIVPETTWDTYYRTLIFFEREEKVHAKYGYGIHFTPSSAEQRELMTFRVVILVTGFATPVVLTCLGYLPYMTGIVERVKPYLIYTGVVGTYYVRPLPYLLGNAPTVGQGLYVALMVILNIILTSVNYKTTLPNAWSENTYQEVLGFVMYRTGVMAFALAPLVFLFSSRNNILLWLSNWSHSTFLLLHRWVARIFGIQVLLHSITALALYIDTGSYPAEEKMPYWIWGAVATVAVSIILVASGLYVRRRSYEIFLITHILLAVFVLIGCWYHIDIRFSRKWGYEMWLYAACAVWFFDRLLRVLRILKTGLHRARVTDIGDDFVRVDVEGVRWSAVPGQHVYAFFPTLNPLRPWENHPFSVLPTAMLRSSNHSIRSDDSELAVESQHNDLEKHKGTTIRTKSLLQGNTTAGLTLFIRKSTGVTMSLKAHNSLLTLLDGPYPNNPTKSVLECDRLLLVGGGIGITGLLPWINVHSNVKLCWSVRETADCLVQAMNGVLSEISEKDVRVGRRLNIRALLDHEVQAGWSKIGVVACGPAGLCDDVRAAVAVVAKKDMAIFELEVDAYSW